VSNDDVQVVRRVIDGDGMIIRFDEYSDEGLARQAAGLSRRR
jgi:hypothetical protein